MKTKMIAFHLPQYYTFPENDKWWGQGFTEWTNVKKAVPLYKGHRQPRIPLNNNYYDLSQINALLAQCELAKKYGIYGFCYYHYWFDGKLLLNKPIELVRDYKGDKINYCLCWANEPWARNWDGHNKDILMPQNYSGRSDWEAHFNYLKSFFKDLYYIKIENAPLLVLYRCNNIPNCNEMVEYWNQRCKEEGYSGLFLVEELNAFQEKAVCLESKAILDFEPAYSLKYNRTFIEKVRDKFRSVFFNAITGNHNVINSYADVWKRILRYDKNIKLADKMHFLGAFVDWDNTPRRGKNEGRIIIGGNPERFRKYLYQQKKIAEHLNAMFVFINAWNEWGEGAYLEPDMKYGTQYLERINELYN